jgi:hypothetical protein
VPLTSRDKVLYAHALPDWQQDIQVQGVAAPRSVKLLRTGTALDFKFENHTLTVSIPAALRTPLVDTISIQQ